jgi:hypothetical protein
LGEIPQRLLLDDHASRTQPLVISPRLGQLAALLHPARPALAPRSPPGLLLNGKIPYKTGMPTMLP